MSETTASVVVPVYNAGAYLERCLESLAAQKYSDFEIICIDDGSSDNSWSILQAAERKYGNLRLFQKENGGASSARNYGQDKSRGKYITFVDADDHVEPVFLAVLIGILEDYEADIALGDKWIQKRGAPRPRSKRLRPGVIDNSRRFQGQNLMGLVAPHAKMFRQSFLERNRIRFLEGITYEDHVQWIECLTSRPRVAISNELIYTYSRNPDSVSSESRHLDPFNIKSRLKAIDECVRLARESEIKGLISKVYRSQLNHSLLRHVLALPAADSEEIAVQAHAIMRAGVQEHRMAIEPATSGWRRLLYGLVLDGETSDLMRACRFVHGDLALELSVQRGKRSSSLHIARSVFPSLPSDRYPEFFDITDIVEKKAA